jgi:hypothetical protein
MRQREDPRYPRAGTEEVGIRRIHRPVRGIGSGACPEAEHSFLMAENSRIVPRGGNRTAAAIFHG